MNETEQSPQLVPLRFDSAGWQIMCQPEEARISFSHQGRLWLTGATFSLASGNGLIRPQDCGSAEGVLLRSACDCSYTITYAGGKPKTALSLRFRTSPDVPGIFLKMLVHNESASPLIIYGFNIIEALGGMASFWPGYGGTNGAVFDWGFQSLSPAKIRRTGDSYAAGISEYYLQVDPGIKPFMGENQFISSWICGLCSGTEKEKALLGYLYPKDQAGYFLYRHIDRTEDFLARSDAEGLTLAPGGEMASEELYITLGEQEELLLSEFFSLKGPAAPVTAEVQCNADYPRVGLRARLDAVGSASAPGKDARASARVTRDTEAKAPFFDTVFMDADLTCETAEADASLKEAVFGIKAAGYRPALWWSPFAVYRDSDLLKNKPQWALQSNGKMVPAGAINGRKLAALDATNPEVVAYLSAAAQRISEDWGYQTIMLDRLYLAALIGQRHNERRTRIGTFNDGLTAIRHAVPAAFLIGRGCPFWPTAGLLDAVDIGAEQSGSRRPRNGPPRNRPLFPLLRGRGKSRASEIQPLNNLLLRSPAGGALWKNAMLWQTNLWDRFTPKTAAALAAFGGEVVIFDAPDADPEFETMFAALHAPGQNCAPGPGWMTVTAIRTLTIKSEQRQGLFVLAVNTGSSTEETAINPAKLGLCTEESGIFVFDRFACRDLGITTTDHDILPQQKLAAGDSQLLYLIPDAGMPVIVGDDLPLSAAVAGNYAHHKLRISINGDSEHERITGNVFVSVPAGLALATASQDCVQNANVDGVFKIPVAGILPIDLQLDFHETE